MSVLPRKESALTAFDLPAGYGFVWTADLKQLRLSSRLPRGRASCEARPRQYEGYTVFLLETICQNAHRWGERSPTAPIFCQLFCCFSRSFISVKAIQASLSLGNREKYLVKAHSPGLVQTGHFLLKKSFLRAVVRAIMEKPSRSTALVNQQRPCPVCTRSGGGHRDPCPSGKGPGGAGPAQCTGAQRSCTLIDWPHTKHSIRWLSPDPVQHPSRFHSIGPANHMQ